MSAPGLSRRHVAAAVIGNALEFYDFVTYTFFALQIGRAFFPSHDEYVSLMLSLGTFGAGFVMRPLGGVVLGRYADRAGRRPAMLLSYLLMGVSILVVALVPPYSVLGIAAPVIVIFARMAQGLALGGEVGSATAFLMEAAPPEKRGFYTAWQAGSQYAASIVGSLVGALLSASLSPAVFSAYGWRIAFGLGVLTIPFGLLIRNSLPETLHLPEATPASDRPGDTKTLLWANARVIVLGFLVLAAGTIFTYVSNYMATFAQTVLHMGSTLALCATVVSGVTGMAAGLFSGALSDRFGRWRVMLWPRFVYLAGAYPVYAWIIHAHSATALLLGTAFLQFSGGMGLGAFYAAMTESLPKPIRGTVFGTVYATAIAIFGGTTQVAITWLPHVTGSPFAPAYYVIAASVIGLIATALMMESAPVRRQDGAPIQGAAMASAE
ncbi:MAG TPA: MFS transporter [Rhizomicrobium sp.]|jgi:MFS family permease